MTFYEDDKKKAARILFDEIEALEELMADVVLEQKSALWIGLSIGRVSAARAYLAATLGIPVTAEKEKMEEV